MKLGREGAAFSLLMVLPLMMLCSLNYDCRFSTTFLGHITTNSLGLALALDQHETLFPEQPNRFASYEEAFDRLLPYHVWQIHDEELAVPPTEEEGQCCCLLLSSRHLADLTPGLKESGELVYRIINIRDRFAKARRLEGNVGVTALTSLHLTHQHMADLPSMISFLQSSTAQVREELQVVQANLKIEKGKWDAIEAERRKAEEAVRAKELEKLRLEEEARKKIEDAKRKEEEAKRRAEEAKRRAEEAKRREEENRRREEEARRQAEAARAAALAAPPPPAPPVPVVAAQAGPSVATPVPAPAGTLPVPGAPPVVAAVPPAAPAVAPAVPAVAVGMPAVPVATATAPLVARPPAPATPVAAVPPKVLTPAAVSTPATPTAPVRGRPRGRPRGRGRGGAPQPAVSHVTPGQPSAAAPAAPAAASSAQARPPATGTPVKSTQQPIIITVAMYVAAPASLGPR